jgi:HAD superfamily hydrolase (TIGR01509 family)
MDVGVIFDMDGVLVDSMAAHRASWWRLAEEVDELEMNDEQFSQTFGMKNKAIFEYLMGHPVSDEDARRWGDRKEQLYREVFRAEPKLFAGAVELIDALVGVGAKVAAGSSGPVENCELHVELLGVADKLAAVVTGNDVHHGKPDPEVFLIAAERMGVPPRRCAVVEDAMAGIEAARRAGMHAIAFTSSHPADAFGSADRIVGALGEIDASALCRLLQQR